MTYASYVIFCLKTRIVPHFFQMFQTYALHFQKLYAMVYVLSQMGVGEYRADHCKFVVGVIYEDAGIGF